MGTFRNTLALTLALTFLTFQVAAFPHSRRTHQERAVDVEAFLPWEEHPQQHSETQLPVDSPGSAPNPDLRKAVKINDDSKVKGQSGKRAINLEGYERPETLIIERDDLRAIVDSNRNEKPVNVVPIVERAAGKRGYNPTVTVDMPRKDAKRDDDPSKTIDENRYEKPIDVVPIVGRAVDVAALNNLLKTCGVNETKYSPTKEFCDDEGNVRPLGPNGAAPPTVVSAQGAEKREAAPDPITDKLSCNGQRYLPSQENCTANGLVSLTPPFLTAARDVRSAAKRAAVTAQCGSGIGSISFDRSTSYCNPITKQVSPVTSITAQGPAVQQDPSLSPPFGTFGQQGGKRKRDSVQTYAPKGEFAAL